MKHLDSLIFNAIESLDWPWTAVIRILLAAMCGGLVGLEREIRGRQAGFRTNLLVCLGSAVVMVVSVRFAYFHWPNTEGGSLHVDPGRIAYSVMTGIGFLGAGTIIKERGAVRGLTTAAGMWCVAAIGLAAGFGLYLFVIVATALVLLALWGLDKLEEVLPRTVYRTVTIRRHWEPGCVMHTVSYLRKTGCNVVDWTFARTADLRWVDIDLHVWFSTHARLRHMEDLFAGDARFELLSLRES